MDKKFLDDTESSDALDIYDNEDIDELIEDDEITPNEAAFMRGWQEAESY